MSEYVKNRFEERQNLNLNLNIDLLLGKRKLDGSSSYQNSVWMAHCNKHKRSLDRSSDAKTRFEEQLIIGMNCHRSSTTDSKTLRTSSDENFCFPFQASQILEGSENSDSKWGDFPMYGIKQKIESILNPKGNGKAKYDDKVSELNFTFKSSKEYRFKTLNNNMGLFQNPNCLSEEGNLSSSSPFKFPALSMNSIDNLKTRSNCNRKKSVSLFEMVSLPADSFDMRRDRKSKSCVENFENEITGGNDLFRNDEGLFSKTGTLASDSIGGLFSSGAKKVKTVCNSTISDSIATPYNAKPLTKDKQIIKSPDNNLTPGPSRISSVELDCTESQIQILPPNSNSKPKDSNSTWLKRLRQNDNNNISDISKPKRSKLENNNVRNQNRVSEQSVKSWIQRWTVAKNLPSEKSENLSHKEVIEDKQFPSLQALAMMGKAMNKFRPCEFQRRGPSVVWNNNEF